MSLIWCVCLGWCVGLGQNLVSTWLHFALFLWFRPLTFLYLLRWIAWRLLIFAWCANPSADRFACFVVCCLVFWTWCSLENSHRKMESKHSARSFFCLDVSAFSCLSLSWLFLFSCHRECIWLALYSSGPCLLFCRISWRQLILMGCARTTCHIWKLHRLMKQIQIIARRRLIWCRLHQEVTPGATAQLGSYTNSWRNAQIIARRMLILMQVAPSCIDVTTISGSCAVRFRMDRKIKIIRMWRGTEFLFAWLLRVVFVWGDVLAEVGIWFWLDLILLDCCMFLGFYWWGVAMVVLAEDGILSWVCWFLLLLGRCLSWVMRCGRSEFGFDLTWFCFIFEIFDDFVAEEWSESVLVLGGFCWFCLTLSCSLVGGCWSYYCVWARIEMAREYVPDPKH